MKFSHVNRRLHLYLALTLLPWFLMYGISSFPFAHHGIFDAVYNDGVPLWKVRFDKPYAIEAPKQGDLRPIGARVMAENGLEGSFGTYRGKPGELNIFVHSFLHSTRLTYFEKEQRLLAEDRRWRWDQFFTGMHARGGFAQDSWLVDAWGVVVDIVCIGFLLWIATGLYMWWQLRAARTWGWVALGAGMGVFVLLLFTL
ncbi:MAG: hypothetical protein HYZ57_18285 [Acidobacteria bacterium]|nr:hypothetical protein [Acidobacteriota bacterium]